MAGPIVTAIVNKVGRTIYRKAGRFISESQFVRESKLITGHRAGAGRFDKGTKSVSDIARRMTAEIGPPIGGGDWVSRVRGSTEKFTDFLADSNQLG